MYYTASNITDLASPTLFPTSNRFDSDSVHAKGRFLWKAVTEANRDVVFDELSIAGLKARGIDFEAVFSGAPER